MTYHDSRRQVSSPDQLLVLPLLCPSLQKTKASKLISQGLLPSCFNLNLGNESYGGGISRKREGRNFFALFMAGVTESECVSAVSIIFVRQPCLPQYCLPPGRTCCGSRSALGLQVLVTSKITTSWGS
jgi:hypothetical protein